MLLGLRALRMTAAVVFSDEQLDAIRSRVSIEAMIGRKVKLQRAGRHKKGLCPFHEEKTASFVVREDRGTFRCYGCGARGNAFQWVMLTEGLAFPDAVRRLAEHGGAQGELEVERRRVERDRGSRRGPVESAIVGRWIWKTAMPARRSIVENWLRFRGLDPEGVPGALDRLRFHPRCPVVPWFEGQGPEDVRLRAPAMVAPISDGEGGVYGVHCTYLAPDGVGKASLPRKGDGEERPTRKMFGSVEGLAVHLTELRGPGPLIVGEGIETTWSYAEDLEPPYRAAATLALENLQGGEVRLRDGTRPLWRPRSDPDRPPFLLDKPGEVIVLVDADMKPLRRQRVQLARGAPPLEADISTLQRAELCAALAVQAWRRSGGSPVRAERPPAGFDFNDLKRRLAA